MVIAGCVGAVAMRRRRRVCVWLRGDLACSVAAMLHLVVFNYETPVCRSEKQRNLPLRESAQLFLRQRRR